MTTAVLPSATTNVRPHLLLPDKDDQPVRNTMENYQSPLLTQSIKPVLDIIHPEGDYFIGADNGIYWQAIDPPLRGCKAPDWYVVEDVPALLDGVMRRSYVMWDEHETPTLVAEYVSDDGSEERDRTPGEGKFWIYERRIRASYYAIYDPVRATLEVYRLFGRHYRRMEPNSHGRYPIEELRIELGIWQGVYQGFEEPWLRAWDSNGDLLLADSERADMEKLRADRLAAKLRELGVDPQSL